MQENGAEQPKVYRHTKTMLKIRSTPTHGKQKAQMREWSPETDNAEFHITAIPYRNRNLMVRNSQEHSSSNSVQLPLPTLDLPESEICFGKQGGEQSPCRTIVYKWYYIRKCTGCTRYTSAM